MSSVTFLPAVGGDGSTVSDDANASTGLANGGHRTRFVPALSNVVAVAQTVVDNASSAASNAATATSKASSATTSASSAAASATSAAASASTASSKAAEASASASSAAAIVLGVSTGHPTVRPSLNLDFANSQQVDPRISFTRASSATRINNKGLLETVASGVPRIDYDPVTLACKGLLIEEARTNLLTYSEQFDHAAWIKNNLTVTANAAVAPDGTMTADKVVPSATSNTHYLVQGAIIAASMTQSFYLKQAESSKVYAFIFDGVSQFGATFDTITGLATVSTANTVASMLNVGNGWYRCAISGSSMVAGANTIQIYVLNGAGSTLYTGDGTSGLYLWGAQLEQGSFPTSYIPTTSAQVTRAAEVAQMKGANFSSWYRQDEGTFCVDADAVSTSNSPIIIAQIAGGADRNQVGMYSPVAATIQSGVAQALLGVNTIPSAKIAYSYKLNNFAASVNGGTAATTSTGTVPTALTYATLGAFDFGGFERLNGHIRTLRYYPKRLSNTELQLLTAP